MLRFIISCCCFFFIDFFLAAQPLEIADYKARYLRRPLLSVSASATTDSEFQDFTNTLNNQQGQVFTTGRSRKITDKVVNDLFVAGSWSTRRTTFFLVQVMSSSNNINLSWQHLRYPSNNRFAWGWQLSGAFNWSRYFVPGDFAELSLSTTADADIFVGHGRIEYGGDALLANWMISDLTATNAIGTVTTEQRLMLARKITNLIGNRTFDVRRRRIYELTQLCQLFETEGIEIRRPVVLFTRLNDNWAFANRATLPHGRRLLYGLGSRNNIFQTDNTNVIMDDVTAVGYEAFAEYQYSHIIGNNSSLSGIVRVGAGLGNRFFNQMDEQTEAFRYLRHQLSLRYTVLPTSRTQMAFVSTLSSLYSEAEFPVLNSATPYSWQNSLNIDYFASYRCQLALLVNLSMRIDETPQTTWTPRLMLSSQVAIF